MNLKDSGEDSLTKFKLFLALFYITGCSSINNLDYFYNSTMNIFNNKTFLTSELSEIDTKNHLIVNIDDHKEILSTFDEVTNSWKTANKEIFIIKDGKLIKSIGLEYDFEIYNYQGFKKLENYTSYIEFKNPSSGLIKINFSYINLKEGVFFSRLKNKKVKYRLIREDFFVETISWKGSNYYWIDNNNEVVMTKQLISPFGNKIRFSK